MMTLGNMRKNWVRSLAITGGILLWLVIIFVVLNLLSDILSEAVKKMTLGQHARKRRALAFGMLLALAITR